MKYRSYVILLILVLAFVGIASRLRRPRPATAPTKTFGSTQEMMTWLASAAVGIAKQKGVDGMDYSIDSIQQAEKVLEKLHDERARINSDEGFKGLATALGAYVGECVRRHSPGAHWEGDHPVAGERSYPLYWRGGESFPITWCYKRIENGPEDNVWVKYQMIATLRGQDAAKAPTTQ